MATDKQPRSVPAHCTPRFSNIWVENNGKPAAKADRSMMLAATVEAALSQNLLATLALKRKIESAIILTVVGKHQRGS
jgi:hypothetical protein